MPEPRRTFAPVVLVGLAAGTLVTVASTKRWAEPEASTQPGASASTLLDTGGQLPLATTLGLVVLAAWGVVLVTKGRVRRAVALLAAAAAAGTLATVVSGYWLLPDTVDREDLGVGSQLTGWYPTALVGAALSLVATLLAVRWVRHWPEMGSRYDAPGAAQAPTGEPAAPPGEQSSLDLWKAMDEGRDPTE
jgi:uncharacterized membrane protein (TIGR02234 family)